MMPVTRREMLRTAAAGATLLALPAIPAGAAAADKSAMPFTLPKLPYAFDALEPHIDARTMEIHHDRHHKTYVDNLNKAVAGTDWADKKIEEILQNLDKVPEKIRTAVRNNGGGHYNHSLFWQMMAKNGGKPSGALNDAIADSFRDLDGLLQQLQAAGAARFGSGWAWVVAVPGGKLKIVSTPNQDTPIMPVVEGGGIPILGVDVWEHAYYLKYQNKRADYLKAWTNVINWEYVTERHEAARKA